MLQTCQTHSILCPCLQRHIWGEGVTAFCSKGWVLYNLNAVSSFLFIHSETYSYRSSNVCNTQHFHAIKNHIQETSKQPCIEKSNTNKNSSQVNTLVQTHVLLFLWLRTTDKKHLIRWSNENSHIDISKKDYECLKQKHINEQDMHVEI